MTAPKNLFRTLVLVLALASGALGWLVEYQHRVILEQRFLIQQMFMHCDGARPQQQRYGSISNVV